MKVRKNNLGQHFTVDDDGSAYIDHLLLRLHDAKQLAEAVDRLNPNCQSIGAGYMQNMRELAKRLLSDNKQ